MNRIQRTVLAAFFLFSSFCVAKAQEETAPVFQKIKCTSFSVTKPLRDCKILNLAENAARGRQEIPINRRYRPKVNFSSLPLEGSEIIAQKTAGDKPAIPVLQNWEGQTSWGFPLDPSGEASATHFFQAINTQAQIYTKTGGFVSGGGPYNLSDFWPGSWDEGDPIVLYDRYADRWFISQFNSWDQILVAVSQTNDPTGSYYAYSFVIEAGVFPDYPKYSIWTDGYYVTSNIGNPGNMAVLERDKILVGDPGASIITVMYPAVPNSGFFCPLSADAVSELPPAGTPCPLFSYEDDSWGFSASDRIRIFNFSTNWTTPSASSISNVANLPAEPFNVDFSWSWEDIPQPSTGQRIDAGGGVLFFKAPYMVWPEHNSVVLCHSVIVNASTKQAGMRWYELRQDAISEEWSIYQQGTYAPDGHSRFYGSIGMDENGSIGLCYTTSSSGVYPSLRFTGRNSYDSLGIMTYTESVAQAGGGSQTFTERWGDYSHTSLDPDGLTFWHTGMYCPSTDNPSTRIYSFQIPYTAPVGIEENKENIPHFQAYYENGKILLSASGLPKADKWHLDLFDVQGKHIQSYRAELQNNSLNTELNARNLAAGQYLLRLGSSDFQRIARITLTN